MLATACYASLARLTMSCMTCWRHGGGPMLYAGAGRRAWRAGSILRGGGRDAEEQWLRRGLGMIW